MHTRSSWRAWYEDGWHDEVAPAEEDLRAGPNADIESFLEDARLLAQTVVECAVEPVREFARGLPRAFAFEAREWRDAWRPRRARP